jgi:Cft2 family RNA processing exonuclease
MLAKDKTTGMSIAQRIDAVLISHPDISHLGALPYAFAKGGMKAKVYATLPVMKLGQLALYDMVQARSELPQNLENQTLNSHHKRIIKALGLLNSCSFEAMPPPNPKPCQILDP